MHLSAAAATTPSGVPPMPNSTSAPAPGRGRGDGAVDVAVGDEADARAGAAHLVDEVVVAVTVEDDDREVADALALRLGHPAQVLRR